MADFPTSVKAFPTLVDLADSVLALHQNERADEIEAIETYLLAGAYQGIFALTGDISPSQITSNQNNYNPTGLASASVLRLSSDAARDITGLEGGADGRILLVHNVGAQNIVLKDESGSSTAGNRFALTGDVTLTPDSMAILQYDATTGRWRALSGGGAGGAVSDGDKGDITVSGSGATWTIDPAAVTLAKMADMATASLLGRNTAGTGVPEVLSAVTVRALLDLEIGVDVQAFDADLSTWAGLTPSANAQSLVTAATYAAMRALLDLEIGVDVQAYDADLTTWAGKTAPSGTVVGNTDTITLTNKRITRRETTEASSATPTINTDNTDCHKISALAAAITSFTTNLSGTPTGGQELDIEILDNGTARAITWGASFASGPATLPTTTIISKWLFVKFRWSASRSKWICMATGSEA